MPRRRSHLSLISSPLFIIFFPLLILLLIIFAIHPFLSITAQILRPLAVKKGWDSINILLVLFAILCGIFARQNEDRTGTDDSNIHNVSHKRIELTESTVSQRWFEYSDQKIYNRPIGGTPLRRSTSSYPDLRQESLWQTSEDQFRFFDDFDINKYRSVDSSDYSDLRRRRSFQVEESEIKEIPVDTFRLQTSPGRPSPSPPPPPPPPMRRTYHSVGRKQKVHESDAYLAKTQTPPPIPPPPPPLPVHRQPTEQKQSKRERKKNNATKEIKMVLASLYRQRKRKAQNTTVFLDNAIRSAPEGSDQRHHCSKPPPPPPLPPPSVFYSLFRRGSKNKKFHSRSPQQTPAPPPPLPPPRSSSALSWKLKDKISPPPSPRTPPPPPKTSASRRRIRTPSGRPPLPNRVSNFYDTNNGSQSPLIPMPPPPPPFKMPEMKFVIKGDFARIQSNHSSRCNSPDLEDVLSSSKATKTAINEIDNEDGSVSVLCPSPDVNLKADSFIARLKDEWRLEKNNSVNQRRQKLD